jgi:hypothetical protein
VSELSSCSWIRYWAAPQLPRSLPSSCRFCGLAACLSEFAIADPCLIKQGSNSRRVCPHRRSANGRGRHPDGGRPLSWAVIHSTNFETGRLAQY